MEANAEGGTESSRCCSRCSRFDSFLGLNPSKRSVDATYTVSKGSIMGLKT